MRLRFRAAKQWTQFDHRLPVDGELGVVSRGGHLFRLSLLGRLVNNRAPCFGTGPVDLKVFFQKGLVDDRSYSVRYLWFPLGGSMKRILLCSAFLLSFLAAPGARADGSDPVACAQAANSLGWSMNVDQLVQLCAGAHGIAAVTCAQDANGLGWKMTVDQIVSLCARAADEGPVTCAQSANALGWSMTVDQIVSLCAPHK